ncbi:TPM domain-containing protein [Granulicella cerasi]|uniref:TPM domain-containing protein n=1 Tax=Granulicella cerasi TaxID=741063 RepID=A0ABW1Z6N7_9BACT|nr:TPM domain-containing protein [Granulicella cerasi]
MKQKLKLRSVCWLLLVVAFVFTGVLRAEQIDKLPAPSGYVNDFASVLDASTRERMEELCTEVDQKAHAQIAVVTIHTLDGEPIEDYAVKLEEKWKVGNKQDRGVLMLFVMDDHKQRMEVGYGLEGILNDAKSGDILRSLRPQLRSGDYSAALDNGVQQVAGIIAQDAHVTLAEPVVAPETQPHRSSSHSGGNTIGHLIFFVVLLIFIFGFGSGGRGGRGGGGGGLGWFLLGNVLGSMGSRDRGGWGGGGGSWGGGGGSSGGGFGGFGGGSSGGGGASSDW